MSASIETSEGMAQPYAPAPRAEHSDPTAFAADLEKSCFLSVQLDNVNEGTQWTATSNHSRRIVVGQANPYEALRLALEDAAPSEQRPCGSRNHCGRFPFCACAGPDPLPERDHDKPAEQQGLFRKFDVRRTDGSDATPMGKHYGCEYFVLDVNHDKNAPAALAAYADAVEATHAELARDMRERYELPHASQGARERDAFALYLKECDDCCIQSDAAGAFAYAWRAAPGSKPELDQINIVREVLGEVDRATAKFPTWPTDPLHAIAILGEEFGELTKAMLQFTYEPHKTNRGEIRAEAVQTAAMALRLAMSLYQYDYAPSAQHSQGGEA